MADWKKHDAYKPNDKWNGHSIYLPIGNKWVKQDAIKAEPSAPDYGEVEKVVLYASQSMFNVSGEHSGFQTSKTKIPNGVQFSMSGSERHGIGLVLHLLALTTNGYAFHLSEVDQAFEVTWAPSITLRYRDKFYVSTAPNYTNTPLYEITSSDESMSVPSVPANVSAIKYLFEIAGVTSLSRSFSIKATSVKLNGVEYAPEVYFEDDLREWLGDYDSEKNILTLYSKLPTLWSKYDDPIKYTFVANNSYGNAYERDYYDKVIFSDRYVDRVGVTNIYPETVYTRTTEIHGLRSIPEGFIDNTTGSIISNYGHCVVYFMNPSNEFVTVASQAFRKPDNFSSSGYTLVVYTDNIFIHDALIADYGSLDATLFSIYHLDGTAWE